MVVHPEVALASLALPTGVAFVRSTPVFTTESVPAGLLAAHRLGAAVWGVLHVEQGALVFVLEQDGSARRVEAGQAQVIEPEVLHHVVLEPDVAFRVELHR